MACIDFIGHGCPVLWRPAFDDVGDVDVLSVYAAFFQQPVEDLSRRAHEWLSFLILVLPRGLSDQHDLSVQRPGPDHNMRSCKCEVAPLAIDDIVDRIQDMHHPLHLRGHNKIITVFKVFHCGETLSHWMSTRMSMVKASAATMTAPANAPAMAIIALAVLASLAILCDPKTLTSSASSLSMPALTGSRSWIALSTSIPMVSTSRSQSRCCPT